MFQKPKRETQLGIGGARPKLIFKLASLLRQRSNQAVSCWQDFLAAGRTPRHKKPANQSASIPLRSAHVWHDHQIKYIRRNPRRVSCPRQLSTVVLGCVTEATGNSRPIPHGKLYVTDSGSGSRHEVQQLIQLQIDTLRLESSLTSPQLCEYHSRSQRITALYRELDGILRDRIKHELKTAS